MNLPKLHGLVVATDVEASGLHPDSGARVSTVSIAWRADGGELISRAFCFDQGQLPGKPGVGPQLGLFDDSMTAAQGSEAEWVALLGWLGRQRLVFHHARYDLLMLRAGCRRWVGRGVDLVDAFEWCTMVASPLLDPLQSASLEACCQRAFGEGKGQLKSKKRMDLLDPDEIRPYARRDAELTLRLYEHQQARIAEGEVDPALVRREMAVCRMIVGMERRGVGVDLAAVAEAERTRVRAEEAAIEALPFEPTLAKARVWFYGGGRLAHCTTDKGVSSVKECCVRELVAAGAPGAAEWAHLAKIRSAGDKWYRPWLGQAGPDGRLRTEFSQVMRHTMRFGSQRMNLQALPHDYRLAEGLIPPRSLIRAAPGKLLFEMDLAGAEVRVAAQLAGCSAMLEAIEAGEDLHGITAQQLFRVYPGDERFFEHRQVSKRCNFALIYNVGQATFRADVEKNTGVKLGMNETKELIGAWRSLYPEFGRINRAAERVAKQRGFVRLVTGRQRWFGADEQEHLYKSFNSVVQGNVSEVTKSGLLVIDQRWPETVVLTTHDSIAVEVVDSLVVDEMAEVWGRLATEMLGVPMVVESKKWE